MSVPTHVVRGSRPADNYTLISNGLIRDRRLSDRARMLAVWLLSHREGFRVDTDAMGEAMGCGRDRVRASLRELEDHGYLIRTQVRDRGRVVSMEYSISDVPQVATDDGKPGDGNHGPENTSPYKKTKFNKTKLEEDQENTSSSDDDGALFAVPDQPASDAGRHVVNRHLDEEFETLFWPEYPRKVGKDAARVAYRAARRRGVTVDQLRDGLRRFVKEKAGTEKRFIAHAATWLNGGRWADEPETPVRPGVTNGHRPYQNEDYWSTP